MKDKSFFTLDLFFALALFCAFAASVLMVLMVGAGVYRDAADEISARFGERTAIAYISARVRSHNRAGGLELGSLGNVGAIILKDKGTTESYETYIYYFDGWIWELTATQDSGLMPRDGEKIFPAGGLEATLSQPGLLRVVFTAPDGGESELLLDTVTGGGAD